MAFEDEVADLYDLRGTIKTKNSLKILEIVDKLRTLKFNPETDVEKQKMRYSESIKKLLYTVHLASESKAVNLALNSLIANYLSIEFNRSYDLISPDLFKLKRIVGVNYRNSFYEVLIPLFAFTFFDSQKPWKFEKNINGNRISFSSEVPPYTRKVKEKVKEVKANFLESYVKALRTDLIGDLLLRDTERFSKAGDLELNVVWIPKLSELKIEVEEKDPDPLLIAKIYDRHYLIDNWDVAGEEPYEHYLLEYRNP